MNTQSLEKLLYDKYGKLLLSADEVAKELGLSTMTIYRMVKRGQLKCVANSRLKLISIKDIAGLISSP
ncbi:helix-turn-helix domain-containing protein [Helicobacter sp.]|uniref:helix-turn-helix transcriptional regulator n=1 Tax=Helicobacter sp. TaxID=218 RepID=UPI002A91813C|nr:helix-turn-helix domain-containing protein [Helicobacter sp.]MDY5556473.1 helix-turn-helix domain-containing protein [Helicobacter sp.]